jgi:hypothetical protein
MKANGEEHEPIPGETPGPTGAATAAAATAAVAAEPVPEWLLERLAAGDLAPARAAALGERLAREAGGAARLARLRAENDETLAAHPPAEIAAAVRRKAAADAAARDRRRRAMRVGGLAMMLAGATATAALVLRPGVDPDEGERVKGLAPALHVYRKAGTGIERLRDGAPARAGDELQIAYVAAGKRFGAVVSLDGAGKVTLHLPPGGDRAAPLRQGGEVSLPAAYQLDAAPRFERFLLVAGPDPFDITSLPAVIRGAASPPAGTVTATITVRKE